MTVPVLIGKALTLAAVAVVVKATAVCTVAALLAAVLRRAAAAVRYTVWLLALGGSTAMVLLTPVAPRLDVMIPVVAATLTEPSTAGSWTGIQGQLPRTVPTTDIAVRHPGEMFGGVAAWAAGHVALLLAVLWLVGALVVLCRSVIGHLAVRRLVASSRDTEAAVAGRVDLDALLASAGIRRTVRLLAHDAIAAPLTTGLFRPVLLFPSSVAGWSDERLRLAVVHELAHVARCDYLGQLVATVAEALFWFHPVIWFAAARLRVEGEHAADDRVLADGCPGITYASHLLDLARNGRPFAALPAATLDMARRSDLETRLRAMLDFNRSRRAFSPRLQAATALLSAAVLIPLAGLRTSLVARPIGPDAAVSSMSAGADSTITRRVDARAGRTLVVTLQTGGAVVIRGWDQAAVELHATLRGRDWRHTVVTMQPDGDQVELQSLLDSSAASSSTAHRFEISVPRHFNVTIKSAGGPLTIHDVDGTFRGAIAGGAITIDSAEGRVELLTDTGDVRIADSRLAGSVHTAIGAVELTGVTGGVSGSAGDVPIARGVDAAALAPSGEVSVQAKMNAATAAGVRRKKLDAGAETVPGRIDAGTFTPADDVPAGARAREQKIETANEARAADKKTAAAREAQAVDRKTEAAHEAPTAGQKSAASDNAHIKDWKLNAAQQTGSDSSIAIRKGASDSTYYIIRMRPDTILVCGGQKSCVVNGRSGRAHADTLSR